MHGPSLAILVILAASGLASEATAGTTEAVAEARRLLDRNDGVAAVAVLEDALPLATTGKEAVLDLLARAYEAAARQSQDAGRARDAETYRENLKILGRKSRQARATPTTTPLGPPPEPVIPPPSPAISPAPPDDSPAGPTMLPEGPPPPAEVASGPAALPPVVESPPLKAAEPAPAAPAVAPPPTGQDPAALLPMPAETPATVPASDITAGDAAFAARDYETAGRIYARLAGEGRLPAQRRDHWIYCRSFEVVKRINARPTTEADWASIDAEIEQIRALNPSNWLGEYLRNLASERLVARKKAKPSQAVVVRGQAPEEPPAGRRPVKPASTATTGGTTAPPVKLASGGTARGGPTVGRWQVRDSANFRVYHTDPTLAARVSQAAEQVRVQQVGRWTGQAPRAPWTPVCEIYLYPTAGQYAQMTGQPEDSPGFSTMGMNGGRIISRRVNLRADHPGLVQAVLPHEVTHVILADFFTTQQIPRWADEGLAVLSEPADEQQRRAADLNTPLAANRLFPIETLMSMDYPDNRYWGLYYAQSVSLTRFLTEQGTPDQMLQFLQTSQREGYETALRRLYKIDGYADLQNRWLAFARSKADSGPVAAAPATGPDLRVR